MKVFFSGNCSGGNIFQLRDPSVFTEIEFEAECVKALCCLFPNYACGVFRGSFRLDGDVRGADIALIHSTLSHWFVVEVELVSHSLDAHVLPQIRCFRFGEADYACITSLCSAFDWLDRGRAESLLRYVPRFVAVVANRYDSAWEMALKTLDAQLLVVSVFSNSHGLTAHEIDGVLRVPRESIGFAKYSAIDKSLQISKSCGLPLGTIQIDDPYGSCGLWTVREGTGAYWITKDHGVPSLPHDEYVQIIKSYDGRISLRLR